MQTIKPRLLVQLIIQQTVLNSLATMALKPHKIVHMLSSDEMTLNFFQKLRKHLHNSEYRYQRSKCVIPSAQFITLTVNVSEAITLNVFSLFATILATGN